MSKLIKLYKQMAEDDANFRGLTILNHAKEIGALITKHKARSVLDYGCGAGDAYKSPHLLHRQWGLKWFEIELYDPAFQKHEEAPWGRFDGVVCSDVLEHIPEEDIDDTLGALFQYARKFVWASVCCRPAKKFFPDGVTNLHVTLKPMEWWEAKFETCGRATRLRLEDGAGVEWTLVETP